MEMGHFLFVILNGGPEARKVWVFVPCVERQNFAVFASFYEISHQFCPAFKSW